MRESGPRYQRPGLRERELARLWESQQLPPESLVTTDGQEVIVRYRGRRGRGPGPDFRNAVLAIDGVPCTGDVELHLRASDFRRHGHHLDRAYLRVMLHVVYHHDAPAELLDGRSLPTVALERWVQRRAGELRALLADPADYREPCHDAVARFGSPGALRVLEHLGVARLRARAESFAGLVEQLGAEEALYRGLARALGLTRNAEAMQSVATALPLADLRGLADASGDPVATVEALLLGAAGLLPGQLRLWAPGEAQGDAQLLALWQAAGAPSADAVAWAAGPYRPGCGPADRLRGLAALVVRRGPPLDCTLDGWRELFQAGADALLAAVSVPRLVGRDRAVELLVNALLPWLLAVYGQESAIERGVLACYAALPAPQAYGITETLTRALRDERGRPLIRRAAAVQGALQMNGDWCTAGGCGRCPLSP